MNWSFDGNHANDVLHHLGHRSFVRVELPADRELRFLVMRDRGLLPIYFRGHDIDVRFLVRGESDRDGRYGIRGPLVRLAPVRLRRLDGPHDLGRFLFRP